jgi:cytochrome c-type protein NapC
MRGWFAWLFKPSGVAVVYLVIVGLGFGALSVIAFNMTMDATNTEQFCNSCHVMAAGPGALIQDTTHFRNKSGVRPTCSDCHVPKEFFPKMWRKIQASREVWGNITGIIDTPEKYLAHVQVMKGREVARMRANDSQECRNCHEVTSMILAEQTAKAREFHQTMLNQEKTCIDCHQGITHMSPEIAERL